MHVPFCEQKCSYCIYSSEPLKSRDRLDIYVRNMIGEIEFYRGLDIGFKTFHIGGGTPSILSEDQLRKIFDSVNFKPKRKLYKGTVLSRKGEMRQYMMDELANEGFLDIQSLIKDFISEFKDSIHALQSLDLIYFEDGKMKLKPDLG